MVITRLELRGNVARAAIRKPALGKFGLESLKGLKAQAEGLWAPATRASSLDHLLIGASGGESSRAYPYGRSLPIDFIEPSKAGATRRVAPSPADFDPIVEAKIDAELQRLTLDQKIQQLHQRGDFGGFTTGPDGSKSPQSNPSEERNKAVRQGIGTLLNVTDPGEINRLQRLAEEAGHPPILFMLDVIHGFRATYPHILAMAGSGDLDVVNSMARLSGREAKAHGQHATFAANNDVANNSGWGRINETHGEAVRLTKELVVAQVSGFRQAGLLTTAKHLGPYPPPHGRDYDSVNLSEPQIREAYSPFVAAVDAGVWMVMPSLSAVNGVPSTIGKNRMDYINGAGFKGGFITDWTAIPELMHHGVAADRKEAGLKAFNAGLGIDMHSGIFADHLAELVKEGKVSARELDERVRWVLRMKHAAGLYENRYVDEAAGPAESANPEHTAATLEAARKSVLLLKNSKQTLPLSPDLKSIAVIGSLGNDKAAGFAHWSRLPDVAKSQSVLEAIQGRLSPEAEVHYETGVEVDWRNLARAPTKRQTQTNEKRIARAVEAARKAEAIVAVVGEDPWLSGEAGSRADIGLPGDQQKLVDALAQVSKETGKPLTVVLMNGRPLAIPELANNPHVGAILETWQLGDHHGRVTAETLFGDNNPGAMAAATFPYPGQSNAVHHNPNSGRPPEKWQDKRYRMGHMDVPGSIRPVYPFGHQGSYTTFKLSKPKLSAPEMSVKKSGQIGVTFTLTNSGERTGAFVPQLYIHQKVREFMSPPVKELKGFERVELAPGESREVTFTVRPEDLQYVDQDNLWRIEPGEFDLWVGRDSADNKQHATFRLTP